MCITDVLSILCVVFFIRFCVCICISYRIHDNVSANSAPDTAYLVDLLQHHRPTSSARSCPCALPPPCYCQCHATSSISVQEPYMFLPSQEFGTPFHPLFVTANHSLISDVTSRFTAFSLLLPPHRNPATNAPWFFPEVGATYIMYLLTYLLSGCRNCRSLCTVQGFLACSVLGTYYHGYFFAFHLLHIINTNVLLGAAIKAVTLNGNYSSTR